MEGGFGASEEVAGDGFGSIDRFAFVSRGREMRELFFVLEPVTEDRKSEESKSRSASLREEEALHRTTKRRAHGSTSRKDSFGLGFFTGT
jgi:hypothetical protein